jgi:hypothetical protein
MYVCMYVLIYIRSRIRQLLNGAFRKYIKAFKFIKQTLLNKE